MIHRNRVRPCNPSEIRCEEEKHLRPIVQFQYGDTPVYPHLFLSDCSKTFTYQQCQGRNYPVKCIWGLVCWVTDHPKFAITYLRIQVICMYTKSVGKKMVR